MIEFMRDNAWWLIPLVVIPLIGFIVKRTKNTVDDRIFDVILKMLGEFGINVRMTKNEKRRVLDAVKGELKFTKKSKK